MGSLWEGIEIPVFGVAGEFASGKTLEILSIDPEHTRLYDVELSSKSYNLPIAERIDVPATMLKLHPNGYKPIDLWLWFKADLQTITPNKFTVVGVDPISDIEQGLCDWVAANPTYFGRSPDQYRKSGGIFWGDVKAYWKTVLADVAVRCQTFAFSVHMRDQFSGSTPTGKREPKGKDTLMELASLALLLERKPDAKGEVPKEPSAIVLKSRLAHTKWEGGELKVVPILPPRLPVATPTAIREFIKKPADYSKLKKGERLEVHVPTEEEKLAAQTVLADKQLEIEKAKRDNLEMAERARQQAADAAAKKAQQAVPTPDQSAQAALRKEEQAAARAEDAKEQAIQNSVVDGGTTTYWPNGSDPSTPSTVPATDEAPFATFEDTLAKIKQIVINLGLPDAQVQAFLAKRNVTRYEDLTLLQAEEIRSKLWTKLAAKDMETAAAGKA